MPLGCARNALRRPLNGSEPLARAALLALVQDLVQRCLAPDRSRRPPFNAILEELQELLARSRAAARAPPAAQPAGGAG